MSTKVQDALLIVTYISIGVLTRTFFHIAPNVEFVTAISIVSIYFLKNKKLAPIIPFFTMIFTDFVIGNTIIVLFTYSAFLATPVLSLIFKKVQQKYLTQSIIDKLITVTFTALFSTIIFYFWTNFGVVVTTSMYQNNLTGLIQSYTNALPFLRNQLVGSLLITPVLFAITYLACNLKFQIQKLEIAQYIRSIK